MRTLLMAVAVSLVLVGAAGAQSASSAPAPSTPAKWTAVGVYDLYARLNQAVVGARLVIRGGPDKYEGTLAPDGAQEPLPFDSVRATDRTLTVYFSPNNGSAAVSYDVVTADSLHGKLTGAAGEGESWGKKIR